METARLRPWPEEYVKFYWLFRTQGKKLESLSRWILKHGIERQNGPRLEKFIPKLEEMGRTVNLYARELHQLRGSERWPNWANNAHATTMSKSNLIAKKAQEALRHFHLSNWPTMERRLQECVLAAQEIQQTLLAGPVPDLDETFELDEFEKLVLEGFNND